jgi:hypothetical protein
MKRIYNTDVDTNPTYFFGQEVEHTPAYGMDTLFVVGIQPTQEIEEKLKNFVKHIFFGANHSFDPQTIEEHRQWEDMIYYFLDKGYLCSLDIPINQVEEFHESGYCEYNNFIPQIRVPIPYIRLWNYNTMVKLDDKTFNATNPGVWTHSLHKLMNRENFTDWEQYRNDKVLK